MNPLYARPDNLKGGAKQSNSWLRSIGTKRESFTWSLRPNVPHDCCVITRGSIFWDLCAHPTYEALGSLVCDPFGGP